MASAASWWFFAGGSLLLGIAGGALAEPAPILLEPSYQHDRFDTRPKDVIREFRAYTISFDSDDDDNGDDAGDRLGIAEWMVYEVRRHEGDCVETHPRPGWFTDDELHAQGIAPDDNTYRYSRAWRRLHPDWYERGHLMPKLLAARLGKNAEHNSHSLLNAVPQRSTFNAGIWLEQEYLTGAWAQRFGKVWVVTGPVVIDGEPTGWIGEEGETPVAVPDALFRVVIKESDDPARPDVLAFLMPQMGPRYYESRPYYQHHYLVSVDEIEALTGLDLLSALPDDAERELERMRPTWLWAVADGDFLRACR